MAQSQKPQTQNSGNKNKSTFVKKRNQNDDIPASASKIKKRIRDVKRTLNKGKHVSAQVVTESKRRLRALEFELGERTIDEFERAHATKYHAVKHFERKKSERKLKQAKKALEEEKDESKKAALEQKVKDCDINLYYVMHFPKTLHYVSLYPKENEDEPKSHARREAILKDIRNALDTGDKDFELMRKRHRNAYKQKLIQKGLIEPEAPIDEEMDTVPTENKEDQSSDDSSDEKDDFFQKA